MKAILFAVLTTFVSGASAADSLYISTELTRNGETVANFAGATGNGVTRPYRNLEFIKYRASAIKSNVKTAKLEVGTTEFLTPVIASDGSIDLKIDMNYVRLDNMDTGKVGNVYIDHPRTNGYKLSTTVQFANGEKRQFRSDEDGDEYIYTVSVTRK